MTDDHTLIRATLVPAIVAILAGHYSISEEEALDLFYTLTTARAFADDSIGLYGQSALNIAGEVIAEDERS